VLADLGSSVTIVVGTHLGWTRADPIAAAPPDKVWSA
jgi:hypothetical protein